MKLPLFKKSLFEVVKFGTCLELLESENSMKSKISQLLSVKTLTSSALIAVLALGTVSCTKAGDKDDDGDGVKNSQDAFPKDKLEWLDTDNDGTGDNADLDDDGDGISDLIEIELEFDPLDSASTPLDTDADGIPDVQDLDKDGDSVDDENDAFPLDATESSDFDGDGTGDNADLDDDNDGYSDLVETEAMSDPFDDQSKPVDTDLDGDPDFSDLDDDNDRYTDADEIDNGTDPLDKFSKPLDTDKDYVSNLNDDDDDNDGVLDGDDAFVFLVGEWLDSDLDGVGDNSDHYPTDADCWSDADGDDADSDSMDGCDQVELGINQISASQLQGHNGFVVEGEGAISVVGQYLSGLGDINKDGFDDYAFPAAGQTEDGDTFKGQVYVFFGSATKNKANLNFSIDDELDGINGFEIRGLNAGDKLGVNISELNDINSDGIDDFMVSDDIGNTYVIFGHQESWDASFDLSTVNGEKGFQIKGIVDEDQYTAGLGDINGDGIDDFGYSVGYTAYLFFGRDEAWPDMIDLTDTENLSNYAQTIDLVYELSGAGDINGDGINEVMFANRVLGTQVGLVSVLFGRNNLETETIDLNALDGTNGFSMTGELENDLIGNRLSHADINNDGLSDLLLGYGGESSSRIGRAYLIFGKSASWDATVDLSSLDGINGLVLLGQSTGDYFGRDVTGLGDFNGDGIDDVLIGAQQSSVNSIDLVGRAYVLYGKEQVWPASMNLFEMTAEEGLIIDGEEENDHFGQNVDYVGDVNGDGINDLITGTNWPDPNGFSRAGKAYLIYGFQQFKPAE
ncbi:integrin alpha [Marinicellulosiphila megalodicopiae]|uniref:integrin alpha n=1 Tax=Marinicellulosiphila megalodicopiae TaxID=2724896 RepID=UPI003BB09491